MRGKFHASEVLDLVDGFQAMWEEAMGREMIFPKGRYLSVISTRPDAFTYS
jgi:hypothetical protein